MASRPGGCINKWRSSKYLGTGNTRKGYEQGVRQAFPGRAKQDDLRDCLLEFEKKAIRHPPEVVCDVI
jgi:hypothetical protein